MNDPAVAAREVVLLCSSVRDPIQHNLVPRVNAPEPRWPALVSVLAVGGIYLALPPSLSVGPRWSLLAIVSILGAASLATHRRGHPLINLAIGHTLSSVITVFLLWSFAQLLIDLVAHREPPLALLRSAALLWLTNVLVFASWYWRLDAGGPHRRAARLGHPTGAFLFPQMSNPEAHAHEAPGALWSPHFIDYLFLAFNTSTAFSPTDAPVLSRWAKLLMILQSLISLSITLVLVARAINIL